MTVDDLKKHWRKGVDIWATAEVDKNLRMTTRLMAKHKKDQLLRCIQELELLNVNTK